MSVKLSKADKIILSEIEWNSKITEKELAEKCHLSKDGVRYRIKRLENKRVIQGYGTLIDYKKLGRISYKIYLKTETTTTELEKIRSVLAGREEIFAIFESKGNWNLAIATFTKTAKEFYNFENYLLESFGELIKEKRICQMLDATINTNKTIFEGMEYKEKKIWEGEERYDLDATEEGIIEELKKNSKITLHELANKTNKNIETVMRKKKQLERRKIISMYNTTINYPLLDIEIYKVFLFVKKYNKEIENKLITHIKTIPQLRNIIRMIGPWKLELELSIKKYEEYEQIINMIRENFKENISDIEYAIFRNETFHPKE